MFVCPECGAGFRAGSRCTRDGSLLADSASDPLLGATVGSYRLASLLGAGGMGRVYKGVHPDIGSRVAVKVLAGSEEIQDADVQRFFAEARAVNLIHHEGIVNVLDLGWLPSPRPDARASLPFILMEHLDGAPLSSHILERGPLPLDELARLALEVLDALAAAHERGIVHRDIKPDNIFVTRAGRSKLLDFGIAKLRRTGVTVPGATRSLVAAHQTAQGSLLGTPHYMAPEQALGQEADARSDLYAIALVLFEGATGRKPFHGASLYELLRQHVEQPMADPRVFRPDMPPAYAAVILRAAAKLPAERFQSARELGAALHRAAFPPVPFPLGGAVAAAQPAGASGASPAISYGVQSVGPATWAEVHAAAPASAYAQPAPAAPTAPPAAGRAYVVPGATPGTLASATAQGTRRAPTEGEPPPGTLKGVASPTQLSPSPPRARRRTALWLGLLGSACLAALVATLVVVLAPARGAKQAAASAKRATDAAPRDDRGGAPAAPVKFKSTAFDVSGYLPAAVATARDQYPDASLVFISANGVDAKGIVDLTVAITNQATYRFRSRAHQNACVMITATQLGVQSYLFPGDVCEDEGADVPLPRCTFAEVMAKATAQGRPEGNAPAMVTYQSDDKSGAMWSVMIGLFFARSVPDDC
ncbi:MAG: serine/threonine protein kinase [Polyangiaceae bacterium]|nr:serine/threonine protein kinase [Polyangiaceae bacterium]